MLFYFFVKVEMYNFNIFSIDYKLYILYRNLKLLLYEVKYICESREYKYKEMGKQVKCLYSGMLVLRKKDEYIYSFLGNFFNLFLNNLL